MRFGARTSLMLESLVLNLTGTRDASSTITISRAEGQHARDRIASIVRFKCQLSFLTGMTTVIFGEVLAVFTTSVSLP